MGNRIVGVTLHLANGAEVDGMLCNITLDDLRHTEQFRCVAAFLDDGSIFHLARYYDAEYDRHGPMALAEHLGIELDEVFPISYDISDIATGRPDVVVGQIPLEPRERLTDEERWGLIREDT